MGRKAAISENVLSQIWQQQLAGREPLVTTGGDTVEVLHPGRPTNDCGPDFRDALISINGCPPLQGDVELHINARDWQAHGHHRDPNYERVILHIAMWHNGIEDSPLRNGKSVPVLALSHRLNSSAEELRRWLCQPPFGEEPCYQACLRHGKDEVAQILEEIGEQRFRHKARRFEAALVEREARQVLYEGLMRALGYSQNKEPFQKLARLLPLSAFEEHAKQGDKVRIQALLLGSAGLLPSQRSVREAGYRESVSNEPEVRELERIWISSRHTQAMDPPEWRFYGIRPENSPTRRIVAASYLLARHRGELLPSILPAMNQLSLAEVHCDLEHSLMVRVDGYWASHFDFSAASGWRPSLIGQSRARDVIVNVVLPFCFAWGHISGQGWLRDLCVGLYHNHPGLDENWITRHMKAKLFGDDAANMDSACQQQGLIQLHQGFCVGHKCHDCPLGGGHAAGHGQPAGASNLLYAKTAE